MKYTAKQFKSDNTKLLLEFLNLPRKLYTKKELMQNESEERDILNGTHILSRYFKVYPFVSLDDQGNSVARCVLTAYPDRDCAYIGFFESIDNRKAADSIFAAAEELAHKLGYISVVGPVDSSFWIRYRLKINYFGNPYTGEPYNKSYYEKFFLSRGYEVSGEYISNRFKQVDRHFHDEKFANRLCEIKEKGYSIVSPSNESFEKSLKEIYSLLIELYSDFQTYSRITEEEFVSLYTPLKKVVDYSMVKMAYYRGKAVGFFVTVPNLGNAANGVITPKKILKILKTKLVCHDYVMLYMGVDGEHRGLGKALAESIRCELTQNGAVSVGALISKGKSNSGWFSELVSFTYEYRLYEKKL